ncbi:hypothetical protein KDD93_04945 [Campylobacter sp. faydin G-24]|uniref:Uncharacterized protein n=1 Tax=Campylobacter anatolicus TaxID=2829105 RepID=A0ABS5HIH8_9BACT|nr:hypothetical protein [Campylobacter anatolicus]MBR8463922.1 hypothetical protein [Campylobacter anatolicus]
MNDFFDSLKEIKKELTKEQNTKNTKQKSQNATTFSKEDAIAQKQERLKDEFLSYIKDSDIRKI